MKMTRFYTNTNFRANQDEIIMFLSLNNQIAQLAGYRHQIAFYNPIVVTITK